MLSPKDQEIRLEVSREILPALIKKLIPERKTWHRLKLDYDRRRCVDDIVNLAFEFGDSFIARRKKYIRAGLKCPDCDRQMREYKNEYKCQCGLQLWRKK